MGTRRIWGNVLFWVIILLGCLNLASCSPLSKIQKAENKVVKGMAKLERKWPEAFQNVNSVTVEIDTVIKEVIVAGELRIDTLETERLVKEYIHDTTQVVVTRFIKEFLDATRDSIAVDTLGVHLRLAGSNIDYWLKTDSVHIKKSETAPTLTVTKNVVVRSVWWKDPWFYIVLILAGLIVLEKLGKIGIFKR